MTNLNIEFDYSKKFYDFPSLRRLADKGIFKWFIINGVMDDGKTYGAKEDMLNQFLTKGETSIWLMNGRPMLSKELLGFAMANEANNPLWKNFKYKENKDGDVLGYYKDELMCIFMSISSATKTGRGLVDKVKNLYYDEFNYLVDKRIYNQQISKFDILLSRIIKNDPRIFLIGNATSMNIPLLYHLKIFQITETFTPFKYGALTILFHNFKRTNEFIKNKYEDNAVLDYFKLTGFYEHAFQNNYINDDNAKVDKNYLKRKEILKYNKAYLFQIDTNFYVWAYQVWEKKTYAPYLYLETTTESNVIYALDRKFVKDGVLYEPTISKNIGLMFQYDKIWYNNITIKQKLYEVIKPFIYSK